MAQRYPIYQSAQDNCYPRMAQVEQDLAYQTFVPNEVNQAMPQTPNYQYEHVHRQPAHPYFALQSNQPFCLPAQPAVMYQGSRLIPRKNRNTQFPSQNASSQSAKRFRIDGQSGNAQVYQTNTEIQTQQQIFYQQMPQHTSPIQVESPCLTSIAKYPLDTQSPANSSPSRSPILNTSVSPTSTREQTDEAKCSYHRYQPFTPAPISQTCHRPANHCISTSPPSTFTPLQVPAESTTSSPLRLESEERDNRRPQRTEILETILIPDEDDTTVESEIVIVSVKSPTILARQDQSSSPPVLSPQTPIEEPDPIYEQYPQQGLPLQHVQLQQQQQQQQQQVQTPAAFPVHNNNTVEQNQFYTPDYDYSYQTTPIPNYITQVQYFALPPTQTEQYNIPVFHRPGTPNPLYACPQPVITRGGPIQNPRRILQPYDYSMPTYSYHPNTNLRDLLPYEEHGFMLHPVSHTHTPSRPKKQGLTKAELKRLKVRKYRLAEAKDKDDSCVICMDEYKDGDKLNVLACNHEYHRDCVKDWLVKQRNCPLCRKEVHP